MYLRDGSFDEDGALKLIEGILTGARQQGYPRTRLIGEMDWALEKRVHLADVMRLEARFNSLLSKYDDPVICVYDLSRFSGAAVLYAMRTHPIAIVGGILQQNPFYVPPEQIMDELRERAQDFGKCDE